MASTYSNLKIQLMATGENDSTWGNVTNDNLGVALEEAIIGTATIAFSDAHETISLTDTNATQDARHMRLNLTGSATAGYNLVVPSIEKLYVIDNDTDGTITVKTSSGSGVAVPTTKTMWVYSDATNVVDVVTHLSSVTLNSALDVPSGGTGATTLTDGGVLLGSGTGAITAMSVLADGEMIVGDGTTDPVAESGATLRTSIGVGTGDTPQFTGVEIGHASDTTLARVSAGRVSIEGDEVCTEDVINVFTVPQTASTTADNDGDFDMNAATHFTWTPAGTDELTFSNITVGRSGTIKLVNTTPQTITVNSSTVEAPANIATDLSIAGTYIISYVVPNGETKALVEYSRALS